MINSLRAHLCKRWLRRRSVKLSVSLHALPKHAVLTLEEGASISDVVAGFSSLHVGAMSYVRSASELMNVRRIGRFCSIGNGVVIGQERAGHPLEWVSSHPFQYTGTTLSYSSECEPAEIGHDVWIGREAMIMEGVRVGTGAVIAARSLVTRDVPPYAVVAGMPARIIRYRHAPDVIEGLLSSAWWELPVKLLQQFPLNTPELFLAALEKHTEREAATYTQVEVSRRGYRERPSAPAADALVKTK